MYVPLRKRDHDPGGTELLIDRVMQCRNCGEALIEVGNVSPQIQHQAAVAKRVEYHPGLPARQRRYLFSSAASRSKAIALSTSLP